MGPEGILPVNKPAGCSSFDLVRKLRRHLNVKKIGHAGTLDPFATGVMVMLVGRNFTKLSDTFLKEDKEYVGTVRLGVETDTYDSDGVVVTEKDNLPSFEAIETAIQDFQGEIEQIPPMFSAKKIKGKKLYELARKGEVIERQPCRVKVTTEILSYEAPFLKLKITCSKGTYIRSIAHDLGQKLGCGGHLCELTRTRSGSFELDECLDGNVLFEESVEPGMITERFQRAFVETQ